MGIASRSRVPLADRREILTSTMSPSDTPAASRSLFRIRRAQPLPQRRTLARMYLLDVDKLPYLLVAVGTVDVAPSRGSVLHDLFDRELIALRALRNSFPALRRPVAGRPRRVRGLHEGLRPGRIEGEGLESDEVVQLLHDLRR